MVDFKALSAPFDPSKISWRVGSVTKDGTKAQALAYLDARDVMQRLDDVCGPDGWQCRYPHAESSAITYSETLKGYKDKPLPIGYVYGKTVCEIGILSNLAWVWKSDGAGDSDIEAEKGALSDAFKRAAVRWGIGRYLYDMPSPWVKIDQYKKIEEKELERLASMLPNAAPGVTFHAPSGLAKTPGKFWQRPNLTISLRKDYAEDAIKNGVWSVAAWEWWIGEFKNGIEKAPDRELLGKFQFDNQHILDQLPAEQTLALCELCSVRADQFKEYA